MQAHIDNILKDRRLLLDFEPQLCDRLADFISFKTHAIYFPTTPLLKPELIPQEKCLLVPLKWQDCSLGNLKLEGINSNTARKVLPVLEKIISLCLENIALQKAGGLDLETGLQSEEYLLRTLLKMLENLHQDSPLAKVIGCPSLIIIKWNDHDHIMKRTGSAAIDHIWENLALHLQKIVPDGALAAVLGVAEGLREFGILLQTTGRGHCNQIAKKLLSELTHFEYPDPLSHGKLQIGLTAGHALYPHDLDGPESKASPKRHAFLLKERARLSANNAWAMHGPGKSLAFGWLIRRGASITRILDHGQVCINLGRNAAVKPGQRYQVYSNTGESTMPKGQIILSRVSEFSALADTFYLRHPDHPFALGDTLIMLEKSEQNEDALKSQIEFLEIFSRLARHLERYSLSITRIVPNAGDAPDKIAYIRALLDRIRPSIRNVMVEAGYYNPDGLIILWNDIPREELKTTLKLVHNYAREDGYAAATGIFNYPFLNYTRERSEEGCLKALEYAELLNEPKIGELDFLALTISADKLFSQGDYKASLEEYGLALTLEPGDPLIMNSMGICLASLNRAEEAIMRLQSALAACKDKTLAAQICYNLGNLYQKENNLALARSYYRQCLKWDPEYFYAWLRLGMIEVMRGKTTGAQALYKHAARLAGDNPDHINLAQRYLAKLEQKISRTDKARELLHDSLLRNPADASSMLLLASTYIEEDPKMAELLARKSLRLGADGFTILASALEAQGRNEEARLARERR